MSQVAQPNGATSEAPARAGLVLTTLLVVAGVANLNLSVANVARVAMTLAPFALARSAWMPEIALISLS